jgi:hypothetical protein
MTTFRYPDTVYVSELPLMWRGCNGMYVRSGGSNGFPVYRLPEHSYYGLAIRSMKLVYRRRWELLTDDIESMIVATGPNNNLPYGDWDNCSVTPFESITTWWRSNNVYIVIGLVLLFLYFK